METNYTITEKRAEEIESQTNALIELSRIRDLRLPTYTQKLYAGVTVPHTQKAKGVLDSYNLDHHFPGCGYLGQEAFRVYPINLPKFEKKVIFARPCPMVPRHGFVESRPVRNYVEFLQLFREVEHQDPEGEVIMMQQLTGRFSAVANNAGVVWGSDNDGATAGKEGCVFIPAPVQKDDWNSVVCGGDPANIGIDNTCYIELVQNDEAYHNTRQLEKIYVVQRRDGPAQSAVVDYIPKKTKVKKVLYISDTCGDLLEWEGYIKSHAEKAGVVVDAYQSNLSSHFAVHAIQAGIPVVTSRHVDKGDTLYPSENTIPKLTKRDYENIAKACYEWLIKDYLTSDRCDVRDVIYTSIGAIHSMSSWDGSTHLNKFRAIGVTALLRILLVACAGELRHWPRKGPGRPFSDADDIDPDEMTRREYKAAKRAAQEANCEGREMRTKLRHHSSNCSRETIWEDYLEPINLDTIIGMLETVTEDFRTSGWDSSYGGPSWGNVAESSFKLGKHLREFLFTPTEKNWRATVMAANTALHIAHNNGLAVTKWVTKYYVDSITNALPLGFINKFAARVALDIAIQRQGD